MNPDLNADTARPIEGASGLAYWAWTIIANVSEGDWDQQTEEWVTAAKTWRDAFHAALSGEGSLPVPPPAGAHSDGSGAG